MGRVVFTWEFGGGLGHIQYNLSLAMKFKEKGHDVICIMKHVANAEKIIGPHGIKVLQAPVFWEANVDALPNTYNYALNLFNLGYTIGDGLISMVKAWRNLFDLFMPDFVVIYHAPTALIALRGTPTKTVLYGTDYFSPPKQSPMPSLIPWVKAPEGLMESSEKKAVKTINKALSQLQAPLLQKLSDLFTVDDDILITFKELDHYETREPTRYWGPVLDLPEGLTLSWPGRFNKKIFCYLKHDNPHSENLLYALKRIEAAVVIYAPGTSEKLMQSTPVVCQLL